MKTGDRSTLLYVDELLVAVNKGAGISLATRRAEPGASAARLLDSIPPEEKEMWGLAPEDLLLVHRLDAGTTGLVLLARDPETHRNLTSAFQTRGAEKSYLALVWGHPRPPDGCYDWPIGPDLRDRRRMKVNPGGRPSLTGYRTLARGPHVSLVELHPLTGRTHQLRVHLAKAGHWIVGDDLYAGERQRSIKDESRRELLSPPNILLHAWRIRLPDSCGFSVRSWEAPLPAHFRTVLERLGMTGWS